MGGRVAQGRNGVDMAYAGDDACKHGVTFSVAV
jgi:hypothetical protein